MPWFRRAAIAAVAVVSFASAASAAPVAYNWTGFYIGANAGYAWGDADLTSVVDCPTGGCAYTNQGTLDALGRFGSGSFSPNSFTGGVQLGYNVQNGAWVWGVELDLESLRLSGRRAIDRQVPGGAPGLHAEVSASFSTDWLITARPRLGWLAQPGLLVYVTGGLALTNIDVANSLSDNCGSIRICGLPDLSGESSSSKTKAGYAVGGGLEWAFAPQWTVKTEYLYVSFGDVSTTLTTNLAGAANPNTMKTSASLNASIARLGVNYKF